MVHEFVNILFTGMNLCVVPSGTTSPLQKQRWDLTPIGIAIEPVIRIGLHQKVHGESVAGSPGDAGHFRSGANGEKGQGSHGLAGSTPMEIYKKIRLIVQSAFKGVGHSQRGASPRGSWEAPIEVFPVGGDQMGTLIEARLIE